MSSPITRGPFPLPAPGLIYTIPRGFCLPLLLATEEHNPYFSKKQNTPSRAFHFAVGTMYQAHGSFLQGLVSVNLTNALLLLVSDTQCVPFPETVCIMTSDLRTLNQKSYQWVGNSAASLQTARRNLLGAGSPLVPLNIPGCPSFYINTILDRSKPLMRKHGDSVFGWSKATGQKMKVGFTLKV